MPWRITKIISFSPKKETNKHYNYQSVVVRDTEDVKRKIFRDKLEKLIASMSNHSQLIADTHHLELVTFINSLKRARMEEEEIDEVGEAQSASQLNEDDLKSEAKPKQSSQLKEETDETSSEANPPVSIENN
jgi:hypothetical protein